jgi:metallophosphoesterase (TIGR03767 family)
MPWLLAMGNHDDTALGTLGHHDAVAAWCTAGRKIFSATSDPAVRLGARLRAPTAVAGARLGVEDLDAVLGEIARTGQTRAVTADRRRRPFTGAEYVAALRKPRFAGAGPVGHGYLPNSDGTKLFYTHWLAERVLAITLDTTNQAGGAHGSIGAGQLQWLSYQLAAHREAYVVVFSHHPSYSMTNLAPDPREPGEERHDGSAVLHVLHEHANVVAWVNGHSHSNTISPRRHSDPQRSFWEINTVSHVDAPQQARVLELAANGDRTLSVFTTLVDSASPVAAGYDDLTTTGLASLYRELAFNDLDLLKRAGGAEDGNTELMLLDPLS